MQKLLLLDARPRFIFLANNAHALACMHARKSRFFKASWVHSYGFSQTVPVSCPPVFAVGLASAIHQ